VETDGEILSHWGDYLDNKANQIKFRADLITFIKNNTPYYDYNYIFTDCKNYFYFFTYDITLSRHPIGNCTNVLEGLLNLILTIGYVYDEPKVV
jgi:hypothetical protein